MDARIVYQADDARMTLATLGGLFIIIFRVEAGAREMGHLRDHEIAFSRERGASFPTLTLLDVREVDLLRFSKESRDATEALARETATIVRCAAIVFDRGGFAASVVRSLVTTVRLVTKQPYPMHVFGDLQEALEWLDGRTRLGLNHASIAASVGALRVASAPPERRPPAPRERA